MASTDETLGIIIKAQDQASATIGRIENSVSHMQGSMATLNTHMSRFGSILTGIAQGVGQQIFNTLYNTVDRLVNVFPSLISKGEQFANTVHNIVIATGMLPQQASVLTYAAEVLGVSTDSLDTNFARLAKNVQLSAQHFKDFGVQIAYNRDGSVDLWNTLQNVRTAISSTGAGALSTAAAMQLFGRSGYALLPILQMNDAQFNALAADAGRSGAILSQAGLDAAHTWEIAQNRINAAITGVGTSLLGALAPTLTSFVDTITSFIQAHIADIVNFVQQAANFIIGVLNGLFGLNLQMVTFSGNFTNLGNAANDAGNGLDNYTGKAKKAASATQAATQAIDRQIQSIDAQLRKLDQANQANNAAQQRQQILLDIQNAQAQLAAVQDQSIFAAGMTNTQMVLAEEQHKQQVIDATNAVLDAKKRLAAFEQQQAIDHQRQMLEDEKAALEAKKAAIAAAAAKHKASSGSGPSGIHLGGSGKNSIPAQLNNWQDQFDRHTSPVLQSFVDAGTKFGDSIRSFIGGVGQFFGSVISFVSNVANFFKPLTDALGPAGSIAAFILTWKVGIPVLTTLFGRLIGGGGTGGGGGLIGLLTTLLASPAGAVVIGAFGALAINQLGASLRGMIPPSFTPGSPNQTAVANNPIASTVLKGLSTLFGTQGIQIYGPQFAQLFDQLGVIGTNTGTAATNAGNLVASMQPGGSIYQQFYNSATSTGDNTDALNTVADNTSTIPTGVPVINGQTGFNIGNSGFNINNKPTVTATGPGGVNLAQDGTPLPIKGVSTSNSALNIVTTSGNNLDISGQGPIGNLGLLPYIRNGTAATTTNTGKLANAYANNKLYVSTSGGGGGGGTTCFPYETEISTPSGVKLIGEIAVGDTVWAVDEETLERIPSKVVALIPHPRGTEKRRLLYLHGGKTIHVTHSHPFYDVTNERFHPVGEFEVGDVVLDWSGIRAVEREITAIEELGSEPLDVYNFEVAAYHNYLANGVLVHNIAKATGGIGLTSGATDLTVGEAGREMVAILRNPRPGNAAGFGGSNAPIHIHLDISGREIAQFVTNWQDLHARRSTTIRAPGGSY